MTRYPILRVLGIGFVPSLVNTIEHGLFSVQKTTVSASGVLDSLKAVKLGKAAGIDGLSAEHFVCAHTKISVHLSLLFTAMLTHVYMTSDLMETAIVPILKNRQCDVSDKNKYRPIAIVTAMSKLLELCIMKLIETHLQVTTSLGLNASMEPTYEYSLLNLLSYIIICVIALCLHVFLMLLKLMIV